VQEPVRGTTEKRTVRWLFEELDTLRKTIIARAGRLTGPQGKLTLTLDANPTVKNLYEVLQFIGYSPGRRNNTSVRGEIQAGNGKALMDKFHTIGGSCMNLIDALERLKRPVSANSRPLRVFLACGFTPLHLETFLTAHLRNLYPSCRVDLMSGLFGDLIGNLERLRPEEHDALAVIIEWSDLDSRLGLRTLGGWQVDQLPDIVNSADRSLKRLTLALQRLPLGLPTSICLPTLPLPPLFYTGTGRSSVSELSLRRNLASFAEAISVGHHVSVVSGQRLDEYSPPGKRFDLRTEITQGFPYKTLHASAIAELSAELIFRDEPKKGLITDLDDTLWAGILGEVGVAGVHWHLEEHAQLHGIYQQFLASLASAGVLIAAASKNDAALVDQAFERADLLLSKQNVFPIEAHWRRKSESVQDILKRWNVLADSVVFVDDSPMEVAEVQAVFPGMECLVFPKDDYVAFWGLLGHLRNRFAKTSLSEDDSLRLQSIRNSAAFREPAKEDGHSLDEFLKGVEGRLTFAFGKAFKDARTFELVNKTNQFNLNGERYDEAAWSKFLKDPRTYMVTVSYQDKFGKLGRIAVMAGRLAEKQFTVECWVMSCRAFSRRIEFHCLEYLFEKFAVGEIFFELQATSRNGPLLEFFQQFVDGSVEAKPQLSRASFLKKCPKLPHHVEEVSASE
jgi:FkbH-like protein